MISVAPIIGLAFGYRHRLAYWLTQLTDIQYLNMFYKLMLVRFLRFDFLYMYYTP